MPLNRKVALVAFDRQASGKGTLAATPKYGFGLRGGSVLRAGMEQDFEALTVTDRLPPSAFRTAFLPSLSAESRVWPRSAPLLLFGALGAISSTGSADPFTHTVTPAVTLPYLTAFTRLDTEYHKIRDGRVASLALSWERAEPLEATYELQGTVASLFQASWTATTDESLDQSFFPHGGVFEVETVGSTPLTADIAAGEIRIQNNLRPVQLSKSVEPADNWPGAQIITVRLRLIPNDTELWRKIVTGSASGTAVTPTPQYGSFHVKFTIQTSPERSLDLTAPRVAFTGEYPEPSPDGGPVELEIEGTVVKPSTGNAFTATVKNGEGTTAYNGS